MELLLPHKKIEPKLGRQSLQNVRVMRYIVVFLED